MKKGRPPVNDWDKILPHIYGEVACGRALTRVLKDDPGMPSPAEFWRRHMADADIRDNLAAARENGVEAIVDECKDIADTQEVGEILTHKSDGTIERKTEDMLGHRKLRIETRLKYAAMIKPRKYGAKAELHHTGSVAAAHVDLSSDPNEAARQYRDLVLGISDK